MSLAKSVSIHVKAPMDRAFHVFTDRVTDWWPLDKGYSHGGDRHAEIHLEGREGGRFYERFSDGEEFEVGRVLTYQPPSRVVFSWQSPGWAAPTEVEVRFTPHDAGTRVELEHRGWERIGPSGPQVAEFLGGGWQEVLRAYVEAANREEMPSQ